MDQEEEIAMQEFAKFEEKLRAQKAADVASPSPSPSSSTTTTAGKGTPDTVPG